MNDDGAQLPLGWSWANLGEITSVNPRDSFRTFPADLPVTFVPMASVDDEEGTIVSPQTIPLEKARRGHTQFKENDVIFAKITPCMENGKAAVAWRLTNGLGFGSTEFHVLRPSTGINSQYLFYLVRQKKFRGDAADHMTGTVGQRRVPSEYMGNARVPVPPLNEQIRIVAKIDESFRVLRVVRQSLQKVPSIMRQLRQSILLKAFRGELTERDTDVEPARQLLARIRNLVKSDARNSEFRPVDEGMLPKLPSEWTWVRLGELISSMKNGVYKRAEFYGKGVPCLRMYNIEDGEIVWKDLKEMILTEREIEDYGLKENDILLNRVNSRELVGKAAVIPNDRGSMVFESKNIRVRVWDGLVEPMYVTYFLQTRFARNQIELETKQTVGMATVSQGDIVKWIIPLAPLGEQKRIVSKISDCFSYAKQQIETSKDVLQKTAMIEESILTKAFNGELVPQDPNDEPASFLLERIRAHSTEIQRTESHKLFWR